MFLEVTRRLRGEGFATASVQTTALWSDRSGQSRTPLKDRHVPVQDMAALVGGNVDELSQVVITQQRLQATHLCVRHHSESQNHQDTRHLCVNRHIEIKALGIPRETWSWLACCVYLVAVDTDIQKQQGHDPVKAAFPLLQTICNQEL